MMKAVDTTQCG